MGNATIILYVVVLIAIFYFVLVRPQQKHRKNREALIDSLAVGTDIYTVGGIFGTITKIKDDIVCLKVADKVEIELLKSSIGGTRENVLSGEK